MTNLKQHLADLTLLLARSEAGAGLDKAVLASKLLPLVSLVQTPVEISAEVFESLDNEGRKLALASFASVLIQTHDL